MAFDSFHSSNGIIKWNYIELMKQRVSRAQMQSSYLFYFSTNYLNLLDKWKTYPIIQIGNYLFKACKCSEKITFYNAIPKKIEIVSD